MKVDLPQVKDGPIYSRLLRRLSAQVSAVEGFFDTVHDGDRCDRIIRGPVSNKTSSGARKHRRDGVRSSPGFHLRRSISAKIFQLTDWKVDSFEKWLPRMLKKKKKSCIMCSSGVHKIFMSWYASKKVSAFFFFFFSTDVHRAEGTRVLRRDVSGGSSDQENAEGFWDMRRCSRASLLNITAALHSAATSVAQQTVTFHFLQAVKMEAGGGGGDGVGMPKQLFVCALQKKIPSSSIGLLNPEQQTNAFSDPLIPNRRSEHSWNS